MIDLKNVFLSLLIGLGLFSTAYHAESSKGAVKPKTFNCTGCYFIATTQHGLDCHFWQCHVPQSNKQMNSKQPLETGRRNPKKIELTKKPQDKAEEYACQFCSYVTNNLQQFLQHEDRHQNNYGVKCSLCGYSVKAFGYLVKHTRSIHGIDSVQLVKKAGQDVAKSEEVGQGDPDYVLLEAIDGLVPEDLSQRGCYSS
jgi:hypothetical protein